MAKARTLVGLDVHATKIVRGGARRRDRGAAVRSRLAAMSARRPGCAPGCRGRCAPPMRPGRPATGSRASSTRRGVECVVAAPSKIPRAPRGSGQDRSSRRRAAGAAAVGRQAARGPGPGRRGGGAARPRPRARGGPRGSDALPGTGCRKLLLRHGIRFDDGRAVDASVTAPGWPTIDARLAGGAGDAARRARRDRRARAPPRRARARDRRAAARLAVGGAGRAGCAACAGSTRSPRSGCAPRSATSSASPAPSS